MEWLSASVTPVRVGVFFTGSYFGMQFNSYLSILDKHSSLGPVYNRHWRLAVASTDFVS